MAKEAFLVDLNRFTNIFEQTPRCDNWFNIENDNESSSNGRDMLNFEKCKKRQWGILLNTLPPTEIFGILLKVGRIC